jgi:hypothetical protein
MIIKRHYMPAVLLTVVAFSQLAMRGLTTLSPWKGGGFGMFSAVDDPQTRNVGATLDLSETTFTLQIPESLHNLRKQLQTYPTKSRAEELAQHLAARLWFRDACLAQINTPTHVARTLKSGERPSIQCQLFGGTLTVSVRQLELESGQLKVRSSFQSSVAKGIPHR